MKEKQMKTRLEIYSELYKKHKEDTITVSNNSYYGSSVNQDWLKDIASRQANIYAVRNTEAYFQEQFKKENHD